MDSADNEDGEGSGSSEHETSDKQGAEKTEEEESSALTSSDRNRTFIQDTENDTTSSNISSEPGAVSIPYRANAIEKTAKSKPGLRGNRSPERMQQKQNQQSAATAAAASVAPVVGAIPAKASAKIKLEKGLRNNSYPNKNENKNEGDITVPPSPPPPAALNRGAQDLHRMYTESTPGAQREGGNTMGMITSSSSGHGDDDDEEEIQGDGDDPPSTPLVTAILVESTQEESNNQEALEKMRQEILSKAVSAQEVQAVTDEEEEEKMQRKQCWRYSFTAFVILVVAVVGIVVGVIVGGDESTSDNSSGESAPVSDSNTCSVVFRPIQLAVGQMRSMDPSDEAWGATRVSLESNALADCGNNGSSSRGFGTALELTGTGTLMTVSLCQRQAVSLNVVTVQQASGACPTVLCADTTIRSVPDISMSCPDGGIYKLSWESRFRETYYVLVVPEASSNSDSGEGFDVLVSAATNSMCIDAIGPITFENSINVSGVVQLQESYSDENDRTYNITSVCYRDHFYDEPGHWYTVVAIGTRTSASVSSKFTFQPNDVYQDTVTLSVFSGSDDCQDLTCLDSGERIRGLENAGVWDSEPGKEYRILVQGYSWPNYQDLEYELFVKDADLATRPPSNEVCSSAQELAFATNDSTTIELSWNSVDRTGNRPLYNNASRTIVVPGTTYNALYESYIEDSCHVPLNGPGVWYTVKGTGAVLRVSTCPGDFSNPDPDVAGLYVPTVKIYEGECNADDSGPALSCTRQVRMTYCDAFPYTLGIAEWRSEEDKTYYVLVHSLLEEGVGLFIPGNGLYGQNYSGLLTGDIYDTEIVDVGDFLLSFEELQDNPEKTGFEPNACEIEVEVYCVEPCVLPEVKMECLQQPNYIAFVYLGANCHEFTNLGQKNYDCQDLYGGPRAWEGNDVFVVISEAETPDRVYLSDWTSLYGTLEISDGGVPFGNLHNVSIYRTNVTSPENMIQTAVYDTQCLLSGFQIADIFGSLLVDKFSNQRQGNASSAAVGDMFQLGVAVRVPTNAPQSSIELFGVKSVTMHTLWESPQIVYSDIFQNVIIERGGVPFEFDITPDIVLSSDYPLVTTFYGWDRDTSQFCSGTNIQVLEFDN